MPTTHVGPESQDALQDIANGLLKARKVIVVTGAGISTNSGIPDFRSENGLYSLIQAQFDAAAQQARQAETQSDNESTDAGNGRASKRRKLSLDGAPSVEEESSIIKDEIEVQAEDSEPDSEVIADTIQVEGEPDDQEETNRGRLPLVNARTTRSTIAVAQPMTSPLSSPPPEDLNIPLSAFRRPRHDHLTNVGVPPSSSPLSSPPPVLFDPFSSNIPSDGSPSRRCSTSPSEVDDSPPSNPTNLLHTNFGPGRNTLPNMKGKDLFDASIWADPLRTSVFYTFATTLRQKVKEVEPTGSHRFISHLRDRGKLVRCYTQNIDQIEEKVGLSTCLNDGPGSRGRFSRKSTANLNQLNKMVDEVSGSADSSSSEKPQHSSDTEATRSQTSQSQSDGTVTPSQAEPDQSQPEASKPPAKNPRRELPKSGVECVFLHGSLELLRCFLCGRVCSWDDQDRQLETMSGQQPECPHCVGATTAREERGKRALGVGKLRPDIVLYGEEHPNAHLISPIVTHDLALCPDLLLILGTSLRVHGLKVMVREFAKAVHAKGGKVVFVNFTKPPESSWGDIIDYWIEWDCDAWVSDLHDRIPKLWQAPEPPKPKKKRESSGLTEDGEKAETKRPPAAYPVALRDTKATGAYCTLKILKELHRISGYQPPARRASMSVAAVKTTTADTTDAAGAAGIAAASATASTTAPVTGTVTVTDKTTDTQDAQESVSTENPTSSPPTKPNKPRTRAKRPRKSAPAALDRPKRATQSTLNPNHSRARRNAEPVDPAEPAVPFELTNPIITPERLSLVKSSILESVKSKPRVRKRKKIDGEEVVMPTAGKRRATHKSPEVQEAELGPIQLPPLKPQPPSPISSPFGRPVPMEPSPFSRGYDTQNTQNKCSETGQLQSISPVSAHQGPLTSMSINMRRPMPFTRSQAFAIENSSAHQIQPTHQVEKAHPISSTRQVEKAHQSLSTPQVEKVHQIPSTPQVERPKDLWYATPEDVSIVVKRESTLEEREAILALTRLSQGHPRDAPAAIVMVPETRGVQTRSSTRLMELCSAAGDAEGELRSWGGRWNTNR
ncbi:hypothetical protein ACHAPT_009645 [Fusarium lateritium]